MIPIFTLETVGDLSIFNILKQNVVKFFLREDSCLHSDLIYIHPCFLTLSSSYRSSMMIGVIDIICTFTSHEEVHEILSQRWHSTVYYDISGCGVFKAGIQN